MSHVDVGILRAVRTFERKIIKAYIDKQTSTLIMIKWYEIETGNKLVYVISYYD